MIKRIRAWLHGKMVHNRGFMVMLEDTIGTEPAEFGLVRVFCRYRCPECGAEKVFDLIRGPRSDGS